VQRSGTWMILESVFIIKIYLSGCSTGCEIFSDQAPCIGNEGDPLVLLAPK
jgi:hypothetical protein